MSKKIETTEDGATQQTNQFQPDLRATLPDEEVQQALEKFRGSHPWERHPVMAEVFFATAIINKKGVVTAVEVNRWIEQSDGRGQLNTEWLNVHFVRSGKSITVDGCNDRGGSIEGKFNIPPAAALDILASLEIENRRPADIFKRFQHDAENFDFY